MTSTRTHARGWAAAQIICYLFHHRPALTPGRCHSSSSYCRSRAVSNSSLACVTRAYPSAQEGLDSPPLTVTVTLNNNNSLPAKQDLYVRGAHTLHMYTVPCTHMHGLCFTTWVLSCQTFNLCSHLPVTLLAENWLLSLGLDLV